MQSLPYNQESARDHESYGVQLRLSLFQTNSQNAYLEMIEKNKINPQQHQILEILKQGRANAQMLRFLPQYGARISELRRMGYCIRNAKIDDEKGRWFTLLNVPHDFSPFEDKCVNCGTPRGKG